MPITRVQIRDLLAKNSCKITPGSLLKGGAGCGPFFFHGVTRGYPDTMHTGATRVTPTFWLL